jgi:unsaturated chondroitin disaccharide hydrolase
MLAIDWQLAPVDLAPALVRLWQVAGPKILDLQRSTERLGGTPVFTVDGQYVAQGWTEWTQGFQFGCALLQFDATGEREFLKLGRQLTLAQMPAHVSHHGVHDHGFNQVSTYGNLRRLMLAGRFPRDDHELALYELALGVSGAVQAHRWSRTSDGDGYIYSFNGRHSLFCDTMRSLRALALAYQLGHDLWGENDRRISLLDRLVQHARTTAKYNVYYGEGRDIYDVWGRVAHESLFNINNGQYRCPSTQQGYSPFSTWTRGLSWIMLGYAEQLEFLETVADETLNGIGGRATIESMMRRAAQAACDFYLDHTPQCGIPYWDTGAPGLVHLPDSLDRPADPLNEYEPVDSSAAAIGAQGLLRLGHYLQAHGQVQAGRRYWQAGLTVARTLLGPPYLSSRLDHQGLLLHVVYHRPRGWDHVPAGSSVPHGESALWGDYHLLELGLYLHRVSSGGPMYTFFSAS